MCYAGYVRFTADRTLLTNFQLCLSLPSEPKQLSKPTLRHLAEPDVFGSRSEARTCKLTVYKNDCVDKSEENYKRTDSEAFYRNVCGNV